MLSSTAVAAKAILSPAATSQIVTYGYTQLHLIHSIRIHYE
jgi:hypothetical protein